MTSFSPPVFRCPFSKVAFRLTSTMPMRWLPHCLSSYTCSCESFRFEEAPSPALWNSPKNGLWPLSSVPWGFRASPFSFSSLWSTPLCQWEFWRKPMRTSPPCGTGPKRQAIPGSASLLWLSVRFLRKCCSAGLSIPWRRGGLADTHRRFCRASFSAFGMGSLCR